MLHIPNLRLAIVSILAIPGALFFVPITQEAYVKASNAGTSDFFGEFAGTPYYVSPEQASARSGTVKAATDVYSLGVTLYELLTLKRPFEGQTSQEVISKVLTEDAPDPRRFKKDLAADLATILLKSLEKDPLNRYSTAVAFAEDLRAFIHFKPIRAVPPSTATRIRKFARRRPVVTSILLIVLMMCLAGSTYYATLPGELYITSPIEGTTVYVDGVVRGTVGAASPLLIQVSPGVHKLKLEKLDAELSSSEEEITVGRGERRAVERALASLRGALRLESTPAGARVTIRSVGSVSEPILATSPALVDLPAGKHAVTFELAGFVRQEVEATVLSGGIVTPCSAKWDVGELVLECQQPGVKVELYAGKTCTGAPVQVGSFPRTDPFILPIGEYSLRATCVDRATVTMEQPQSISIQSNQTTYCGLWLPEVTRTFEAQLAGRVYGVTNANFGISGQTSYVFGTEHGQIVAVRPDGTAIFDVKLDSELREILAFDWDGDGVDEVFGRVAGAVVFGINKSGETILKSNRGAAGGGIHVTRDTSAKRVLVAQSLGPEAHLLQFQKPPRSIRASSTISDIQVADINSDGDDDALISTRAGVVEGWTLDDTPKRFLQFEPGGPLKRVLALRSVTRATAGFVAISTDDHAYFSDKAGTRIKDVTLPEKMRFFRTVDLGSDENEHAFIIQNKLLHVYSAQGELRAQFATDATVDAVIECDLDRDGRREVIAGTVAGRLHVWEANGTSLFDVELGIGPITSLHATTSGAGAPLILATSRRGFAMVVDRFGVPVFSSEMRGRTMNAVFTDADLDGVPEVAMGTWLGHAAILRMQDRVRFSVDVGADGYSLRGVPAATMSIPGLLIGALDGRLMRLDSSGHIVKERNFGSTPIVFQRSGPIADSGILVALANTQLHCVNSDFETNWQATLPGKARAIVASDLDGDGKNESAVVTGTGHYVALSHKGEILWEVKSTSFAPQHLATGDVDKDGKSEVAIEEGAGVVTVRDAKGFVKTNMDVNSHVFGLVMADFNDDGKSDVAVSSDSEITAFDGSGAAMFRVPGTKQLVFLTAADVNMDGRLDFVGVSQGQYIYFGDTTARVIARRPESRVILGARVADFDVDGVPDLAIVDATGHVQRLAGDGSRIVHFQSRDVARAIESTDLDGDGREDLIACCDGSSIVTFDVATPDPRADLRRLFYEGVAAAERGEETVASDKLTKAGVSWTWLDSYGVDELTKRLETLPTSPAAVKALATLRSAVQLRSR